MNRRTLLKRLIAGCSLIAVKPLLVAGKTSEPTDRPAPTSDPEVRQTINTDRGQFVCIPHHGFLKGSVVAISSDVVMPSMNPKILLGIAHDEHWIQTRRMTHVQFGGLRWKG